MTVAAAMFRKDATEFLRDRRLVVAALVVLLLAFAAVLLARQQVAAYERDRAVAESQDRQTWLGQGERNPHGAAHFNAWAFRPLTAMALIEPGVTPYAGAAIWMEAHNQDPAVARAVEDRAATLDLGSFSLAWVVQTLAPLLVAVLAVGLIARERERGTLRLMLASGVAPGRVVGLKAQTLAALVALILAPLLIVAVVALLSAPVAVSADQIQRLALWLAVHAAYLGVAVALAVAVSARARSVDRALLIVVAAWLIAVPLAPRLGAAAGDALAPSPTARAFWSEVQTELGAADVFDPADPATKALEARTLRQYRVRRIEDLPVSFEGIQLDAAERHGNTVFDRRYGALHAVEDRQRWVQRIAALFSPLVAVQNISTGLAGTDNAHQRGFAGQAERHRRLTVGLLNADMVRNGGKAAFDYKADAALWSRIPPFVYRAPGWASLAGNWVIDLAILAGWIVAAFLALRAAAWAMMREDAA